MLNNIEHQCIPFLFGSVGTAFGFVPMLMLNAAMLVTGEVVVRRQNNGGTA